MTAHTMAEISKGYLSALRAPPLVKMDGRHFVFLLGSREVYDCDPLDAGDALRMICNLSDRKWVTVAHLDQFASLAARRFGSGRDDD